MTASTWSRATSAPARTGSSVIVPATGATTVCSIFIASTTTSGWPGSTSSPTAAFTACTVPGIGLRTAPAAACGPADRRLGGGVVSSAQACPSRPSQRTGPSAARVNRDSVPP
jgi:hypothetical protein